MDEKQKFSLFDLELCADILKIIDKYSNYTLSTRAAHLMNHWGLSVCVADLFNCLVIENDTNRLREEMETYNQTRIGSDLQLAFETAAVRGNISALQLMIRFVDVDLDRGFVLACRNGHLMTMKYFVSFGMDINSINNYYNLHDASVRGHLHVVEYLVLKKVDVNSRNDRSSPIISASTYGHLDVIRYLVSNKADIHTQKNCAFIAAAASGHLDVVKFWVSNKADIHAHDNRAFVSAANSGHLDVTRYLVSNKADIHAQEDRAFVSAASCGHLDVVRYLVLNKADVHAQNNRAIASAELYSHKNTLQYLISIGAY